MSTTFLSSRELSKRPGWVLRNLKKNGLQVITQNGQPAAIMVSISAKNLEDELAAFRRFRIGQAVEHLRADAAARNLHQLTEKEIAAEIATARAMRRRHGLL